MTALTSLQLFQAGGVCAPLASFPQQGISCPWGSLHPSLPQQTSHAAGTVIYHKKRSSYLLGKTNWAMAGSGIHWQRGIQCWPTQISGEQSSGKASEHQQSSKWTLSLFRHKPVPSLSDLPANFLTSWPTPPTPERGIQVSETQRWDSARPVPQTPAM